jgi:hypothetical protein
LDRDSHIALLLSNVTPSLLSSPQSILHPYLVPPSGMVVYLNIFFYSPLLHYAFSGILVFFQLFSFDLVNKDNEW